jgi:hypothetical protein
MSFLPTYFRRTRVSGRSTPIALKRRPFTAPNSAVFAPMPSASDSTATSVTTGVATSCRHAMRMSCR